MMFISGAFLALVLLTLHASLQGRVKRLERRVAQLERQFAKDVAPVDPAVIAAQHGLTTEHLAEIVEEVDRDRMIQAIKIYRKHTGVGLKEAKTAVAHFHNIPWSHPR